jgi:hypothetical protein
VYTPFTVVVLCLLFSQGAFLFLHRHIAKLLVIPSIPPWTQKSHPNICEIEEVAFAGAAICLFNFKCCFLYLAVETVSLLCDFVNLCGFLPHTVRFSHRGVFLASMGEAYIIQIDIRQ